MKLIGELLSLPLRIVNIPIRTAEILLDSDRVASVPLDTLAKAIEEAAEEAK